jgi:methylenetetrahydrofolate dehydrogenase (NADP+)/methenyltetrahydrofolate cyclohydrolase
MITDGKAIALDIEEKVRATLPQFSALPRLAIVVVGKNSVIESFVRIKKRVGERLGIAVIEHAFPETISGEELKEHIRKIGADPEIAGLIIQLPLPVQIDVQAMLDAVPLEKDVDMLSREAVAAFARGDARILPPVAGAIQEILERGKIDVGGKEVLILGYGRLVGVPASILLRHNHAHVTVIDREVADLAQYARESAIIISGVGKPRLILPEMLTPGVVLIDAGTSETGGKIVGDVDPLCADIASIFTPVPGGVGPIAVAMIFKNLCILGRAGAPKG